MKKTFHYRSLEKTIYCLDGTLKDWQLIKKDNRKKPKHSFVITSSLPTMCGPFMVFMNQPYFLKDLLTRLWNFWNLSAH